MLTSSQAVLLEEIVRIAHGSGQRLFVVGGIVRDTLLGTGSLDKDIDIVVEGNAIDLARRCADLLGAKLDTFPKFLTAKISGLSPERGFQELDFASSRRERYPRPGVLPEVEPSPIGEDLARRDFTINAIALPLGYLADLPDSREDAIASVRHNCLDLHGGLPDLDARLVRVLHDRSFIDDPTRVYRALRYAARIGGLVEDRTEHLLIEAVAGGAIRTVSEFRRYTEFRKILSEERPVSCLGSMERYGLLEEYLPYPRSSHEMFTGLVQSMSDLPASMSELRSRLVPLLLLHVGGDETAAHLARIGLGKKIVASMLADVERARSGNVADMDSSVVAAFCAVLSDGSKREAALAAAQRLNMRNRT